MAQQKEPMSDAKLNSILDSAIRNAIGYSSSGEISTDRQKALEMYLGMPDGTEEEGRSKLQDSTVHDTIESLLPPLLAPFISTDSLCEFLPKEQGDTDEADVQTKYVNHIIKNDNDSVSLLYTFAKDGLLQKNGFIFVDWCQTEKTRRTSVRLAGFMALLRLTQNPSYEVIQVAAFDGNGAEVAPDIVEQLLANANLTDEQLTSLEGLQFDVDFRVTEKQGRVVIRNVPPEYALISSDATSIEQARVVGWQEQVTLSKLREEGYDEDKIQEASRATATADDNHNGERNTRTLAQGGTINGANQDNESEEASKLVWRTVVWMRVDVDGDGKAELRKIIRAGQGTSGGAILYNEEADFKPIVTWTPVPMPHQLFGLSSADQAMKTQEAKTALIRQAMNGVYDTVAPRYTFVEELAGVEAWQDLMMKIPGAPVRVLSHDGIRRLNDAPDLGNTYQMLELFDRISERRTPVTRSMAATDPDALNNVSATAARLQQNASNQRLELIMRLFAEAVGKMCKMVLQIAIKHQDRPRMLRLIPNMPPIEIDPRFWDADMDVSVKVGLGTGTKEQQMQSLMLINNMQMQDLQMGLPTVDIDKLYNTRAQIVSYAGLPSADLFFNDPTKAQEEQGEPQPQAPDEQAQMQEAQQIEQAIGQAREDGKREAVDSIKLAEIESKERMHAKEMQLRQAELITRNQENQMQAVGLNV